MPSPLLCSQQAVGRCRRSGRYCARRDRLDKSAPKPPVHRITGPRSSYTAPPFVYAQPTQPPPRERSNLVTHALAIICTASLFCANACSSACETAAPRSRSRLPWVRGAEWPGLPERADKSRPKASASQSRTSALPRHSSSTNSALIEKLPCKMSATKLAELSSWMPFACCILVPAPLIPFTKFPDVVRKRHALSSRTTLVPGSFTTPWAAAKPARPPPTTTTRGPSTCEAVGPAAAEDEVARTVIGV
mmetsp:Transcript_139130/g.444428  ORF Transcript_139130/g.444428 Transcript_139130/m.444428 type:complete len:248 (+) Transcript_139130:2463-3206(+)